MAYTTKYIIEFTNIKGQDIYIYFREKNGSTPEADIQKYDAVDIKFDYNSNSEDFFKPISGSSLTMEFFMGAGDRDYWNDFVSAEKDTWYVEVFCDTFAKFKGFVLPDEGRVPFQDRPYTAVITATDGIGLLKEQELKRPNGTQFDRLDLIITYIAAALQQTGLQIPIRVIDNVFHKSHNNRDVDPKWDLFGQTYLEYRTFQEDDGIKFTDAYTALEIILKENYRLNYWNGEWVIIRLGMLQYYPFVGYYTIYDFNGENAVGYEITEDYARIGAKELIYPTDENQFVSQKMAVKTTRTTYKYRIRPELPKNNRFERGGGRGSGVANLRAYESGGEEHREIITNITEYFDANETDQPVDTTVVYGRYQLQTVEGWEFGARTAGDYNALPFNLQPVNEKAYIKKVFNDVGVETDRTVYIEKPLEGAVSWLRSEGIPVVKGDKISISHQFRYGPGTQNLEDTVASNVYIVSRTGNVYYSLYSFNGQTGWVRNSLTDSGLKYSYASASPMGSDDPDENAMQKFQSISVESTLMPISGTLYIVFPILGNVNIGQYKAIKDFKFEYIPYIASGFAEVSGEYDETTQNKPYIDKTDNEVFIADNPHAVFKGCLLDAEGFPLTPAFYRMGIDEKRRFNALTNLMRFNLEYRRFLHIEGTFAGLMQAANNNQLNPLPIALHTPYRFMDIPGEDRRFALVPPVPLDLIEAEGTNLQFREVFTPPIGTRTETEDTWHFINRFVAEINAETAEQWNAQGAAPASGIPGFPPLAFTKDAGDAPLFLQDRKDAFGVAINTSDTMTISAADIAGGAAPAVNKYYEIDLLNGYRLCLFEITGELKVGHVVTVKAYNHNVGLSVIRINVPLPGDGQMLDGAQQHGYIYS